MNRKYQQFSFLRKCAAYNQMLALHLIYCVLQKNGIIVIKGSRDLWRKNCQTRQLLFREGHDVCLSLHIQGDSTLYYDVIKKINDNLCIFPANRSIVTEICVVLFPKVHTSPFIKYGIMVIKG